MSNYTRIDITAAEELISDSASTYAVYLPRASDNQPVLYREAGVGLSQPDFERLRSSGVSFLYMLDKDLEQCTSVLEAKLAGLLASPHVPPEEKARLVHKVGTTIARDLTHGPVGSDDLDRATQIMDNVIGAVLNDPAVAANMLMMAGHERSTASHMFVVSALAIMLGAEVFGSDYEILKGLGMAGMMHDLGKLGISQEILNSPTPLSPSQLQLIHQHPIESVRLLGDDPHVSPAVRQMILQHHERMDGKGYPLGTSGNELLPGSRILSIVDSFHAMIGHRAYRRPLTPKDASRTLNAQAGRQFDQDMLARWNELFERCWVQGEPMALQLPAFEADEASSRHEHSPPGKRRNVFGARPKRYDCKARVMVRCVYAGRLHDATCAPDEFFASVHDVSPGGLCIYSSHPMYRGEVVHVQVNKGAETTWIRGTVAWCRQHDDAIYKTGLKFLRHISESEARTQVDLLEIDGTTNPHQGNKTTTHPKPTGKRKNGHISTSWPNLNEALNELDRIASLQTISPSDEKTAVQLAGSTEPKVRHKSIEVLARIATKAPRMTILSLLKDIDPEVRERAVDAAGSLRMEEAAYLLRQRLSDPVETVALRAAGALGLIGERTGLPLVARALARDNGLTRLAARTFGEIVGHRFPANADGIQAARRYLAAKKSVLRVS